MGRGWVGALGLNANVKYYIPSCKIVDSDWLRDNLIKINITR